MTVEATFGTEINGYNSATGLKYAIAAYAKKGEVESEKSYEYATRTVLKLRVVDYAGSCPANSDSDVTENGRTLKFGETQLQAETVLTHSRFPGELVRILN